MVHAQKKPSSAIKVRLTADSIYRIGSECGNWGDLHHAELQSGLVRQVVLRPCWVEREVDFDACHAGYGLQFIHDLLWQAVRHGAVGGRECHEDAHIVVCRYLKFVDEAEVVYIYGNLRVIDGLELLYYELLDALLALLIFCFFVCHWWGGGVKPSCSWRRRPWRRGGFA